MQLKETHDITEIEIWPNLCVFNTRNTSAEFYDERCIIYDGPNNISDTNYDLFCLRRQLAYNL